jgi:hypothetical protein
MKNQLNTCKFVLVKLDNCLLVQESDWWYVELHNTLNFLHLHLLELSTVRVKLWMYQMCLIVNWVWERLQVSCQWAEVREFSIVTVRTVASKQVGVNAVNTFDISWISRTSIYCGNWYNYIVTFLKNCLPLLSDPCLWISLRLLSW